MLEVAARAEREREVEAEVRSLLALLVQTYLLYEYKSACGGMSGAYASLLALLVEKYKY